MQNLSGKVIHITGASSGMEGNEKKVIVRISFFIE